MARSDPDTFEIEHTEPGDPPMVMFLFLVIALAVVVAAVTLAVVGGGEGTGPLPEVAPERLHDPLPADRPVDRDDVDRLRFPLAARGYRMADVDDALNRLAAELAERDARIAHLESALAGAGSPAAQHPVSIEKPAPEDHQ